MSKLFTWLKPSMEGPDGKASARSLTNFWYVILNTGITICVIILGFDIAHQQKPTDEAVVALRYLIYLCIIFNVTILIIFGIVSIQQVTEGIRAFRGQPTMVEETTKTSKTITEIKPSTNEVPVNPGSPASDS